MSDPSYKSVLITGASSGIGREMALWWARRGSTVYAAARRMSNLEDLARAGGSKIIPVSIDVSKAHEAVKTIQRVDDECGGLDLVVANAGVADPTPAQLTNWALAERVLNVNVMGAAATITAVLPRMIERGRGHVAGVSSVAGYMGLGAYSCYSGSKAFFSTFLQSLRVDLHGTPVKVTCIEPGFVKSEMSAKLEGRAPMIMIANTDVAADKFCRAILRGARTFAFPKVHAIPGRLISVVPSMVYEPLAKKSSMPQLQLAQESLQKS